MSEEMIKVLDYLGEKFGIVIDWASTNVMPQIQSVLHRLTIYEIVVSAIWAVAGLLGVIAGSRILWKIFRGHSAARETQTSNFWWRYWKWHT